MPLILPHSNYLRRQEYERSVAPSGLYIQSSLVADTFNNKVFVLSSFPGVITLGTNSRLVCMVDLNDTHCVLFVLA